MVTATTSQFLSFSHSFPMEIHEALNRPTADTLQKQRKTTNEWKNKMKHKNSKRTATTTTTREKKIEEKNLQNETTQGDDNNNSGKRMKWVRANEPM